MVEGQRSREATRLAYESCRIMGETHVELAGPLPEVPWENLTKSLRDEWVELAVEAYFSSDKRENLFDKLAYLQLKSAHSPDHWRYHEGDCRHDLAEKFKNRALELSKDIEEFSDLVREIREDEISTKMQGLLHSMGAEELAQDIKDSFEPKDGDPTEVRYSIHIQCSKCGTVMKGFVPAPPINDPTLVDSCPFCQKGRSGKTWDGGAPISMGVKMPDSECSTVGKGYLNAKAAGKLDLHIEEKLGPPSPCCMDNVEDD